jgi:formate dehydrogenase gamma subunit
MEMPRALLTAAVLLHPATAIVAIAGILVHIYMGLAAVPGALRGMVRGDVTRGWAAAHHPKWLREISRR